MRDSLGCSEDEVKGMHYFRELFLTALAAAVLLGSVTPKAFAQASANPPQLKAGQEAPDFKLQYFDGTDLKDINLSQFRGKKNVIVAFYIFAFTGG